MKLERLFLPKEVRLKYKEVENVFTQTAIEYMANHFTKFTDPRVLKLDKIEIALGIVQLIFEDHQAKMQELEYQEMKQDAEFISGVETEEGQHKFLTKKRIVH